GRPWRERRGRSRRPPPGRRAARARDRPSPGGARRAAAGRSRGSRARAAATAAGPTSRPRGSPPATPPGTGARAAGGRGAGPGPEPSPPPVSTGPVTTRGHACVNGISGTVNIIPDTSGGIADGLGLEVALDALG